MIAPVDAIKMVDVRIEEDIIMGYRRTRRKTVQGLWTLFSSYVMIQTNVVRDCQPLHDRYLQNFVAHQDGAKPRSLGSYSPIFKTCFPRSSFNAMHSMSSTITRFHTTWRTKAKASLYARRSRVAGRPSAVQSRYQDHSSKHKIQKRFVQM